MALRIFEENLKHSVLRLLPFLRLDRGVDHVKLWQLLRPIQVS